MRPRPDHVTRRRDERGTLTLYVLGLCVAVLFLGGLSLDLWRVIAVRRDLATMADAAAAAGADGLDEDALRTGVIRLDAERARRLARDNLAAQSDAGIVEGATIDVRDASMSVTLQSEVRFTLLRVFLGADAFQVDVTSDAEPRRRA